MILLMRAKPPNLDALIQSGVMEQLQELLLKHTARTKRQERLIVLKEQIEDAQAEIRECEEQIEFLLEKDRAAQAKNESGDAPAVPYAFAEEPPPPPGLEEEVRLNLKSDEDETPLMPDDAFMDQVFGNDFFNTGIKEGFPTDNLDTKPFNVEETAFAQEPAPPFNPAQPALVSTSAEPTNTVVEEPTTPQPRILREANNLRARLNAIENKGS